MERGEQNIAGAVLQEKRRDQAWGAYMGDFADIVDAQVIDENERMELDTSGGREGFVEDAVQFGLRHLDRFTEPLRELIQGSYLATGKMLFDAERGGGLFLDAQGAIVLLKEQEMSVDFSASKERHHDVTAAYGVLTGPDAGKTFSSTDRPLWTPSMMRGGGVVAEA